jgi:hypothetical protein
LATLPRFEGQLFFEETTAAAVRRVANVLGQSACEDVEDIAEHAMRVSGAQLLARSGVELYITQLYGRWGSSVIERYVQETPLAKSVPATSSTESVPPPRSAEDTGEHPTTSIVDEKQYSRTVIVSKFRLQHVEKFDLVGVNSTLWSTSRGQSNLCASNQTRLDKGISTHERHRKYHGDDCEQR